MKNLYLLVYPLFLVVFFGCQKPKNSSLASNYYNLSRLELEEGGDEFEVAAKKSLGYLDEAIRHDKKGEYLATKATLLFQLKNFIDAKQFFDKTLECRLEPKLKCEVLNNYAALLAQLGDEDRAQKIWEGLDKDKYYLTPEVALFNLGKLSAQRKDYSSAKNKFMEATRVAPNYVDAHFYLSVVAGYYLKDLDLAKKEVEMVLSLEPGHMPALQLEKSLLKQV